MTNTDRIAAAPLAISPSPTSSRIGDRSKLRWVLRINASSSFVCGIALAAAPAELDRMLGTGHPGWVRSVGAALIPFALLVAWLSIRPASMVRAITPAVIAADLAWVVASVVTVLLGWYSTEGVALVLAMAGVVDAFAALQWWGLQRPSWV